MSGTAPDPKREPGELYDRLACRRLGTSCAPTQSHGVKLNCTGVKKTLLEGATESKVGELDSTQ